MSDAERLRNWTPDEGIREVWRKTGVAPGEARDLLVYVARVEAEVAALRKTPSISFTGVVHELKCDVPYFEAVATGGKTVEVRRDDRGFDVGDVLMLEEYDGHRPVRDFIPKALTQDEVDRVIVDGTIRIGYTGRTCRVLVTHILRGAPFVPDGYAALSIRRLA